MMVWQVERMDENRMTRRVSMANVRGGRVRIVDRGYVGCMA